MVVVAAVLVEVTAGADVEAEALVMSVVEIDVVGPDEVDEQATSTTTLEVASARVATMTECRSIVRSVAQRVIALSLAGVDARIKHS